MQSPNGILFQVCLWFFLLIIPVFLQNLSLHQFKNYESAEVEFCKGINCLFGKNGSGKTNLLDAIYYLAFTKSAFDNSDQQNSRNGHDGFLIKGIFQSDKKDEVVCSFQLGHKKKIRENEVEYQKFSDHFGKYPVVLIAPNDIELIWGGSELRRKFFDSLISQVDRQYLESLMTYHQILKQRNGFLRISAERGNFDRDLLDTYDLKLSPLGNSIFERRQEFIKLFTPYFSEAYHFLSGNATEVVVINYQSDLAANKFYDLLANNVSRDLQLQRTTQGIHRDDFDFRLNGFELKRYGSQGQQKSFLIGLKLAEFKTLATWKNKKPILLLDDIFDKLDDERIQRLMELVANGEFGQLFITDARANRSSDLIKQLKVPTKAFLVENGKLSAIS